jgi:hypothetical protein
MASLIKSSNLILDVGKMEIGKEVIEKTRLVEMLQPSNRRPPISPEMFEQESNKKSVTNGKED